MTAVPVVRHLGRVDYRGTETAMRALTAARDGSTADEIWICEHDPVYTLGVAAREDDRLVPDPAIPMLRTDRGGQITYHGPGQVVAYALIDLRRQRCYVREYVFRLEQVLIQVLGDQGVTGHRVAGAPGIYVRRDAPFDHTALTGPRPHPFVGLAKIAAIGVKVSRHCTYHGAALNVAMALEPFRRIRPCGYEGLETTDLSTIGIGVPIETVGQILGARLAAAFTA